MRRRVLAGNWKMNTGIEEGTKLAVDINKYLCSKNLPENFEVMIAPPFTHLYPISKAIDNSKLILAAQNCASTDNGAFTGEISAKMLQELGVKAVILGHSERRSYFKEDNEILLKKIKMAIKYDLDIIFCLGESLEQRESGKYCDVITEQISETILKLDKEEFKKIIIAYEPVWAIGTGKTATPDQAQEITEFLRNKIKEKFDENVANSTTILYTGSINPSNAKDIFSKKDVDGGVIGRASLKVEDFCKIIDAL